MAIQKDPYQKVKQETIDSIRKMGMSEAVKKFKAGEGNNEFREAIVRFYPGAAKTGLANTNTSTPAPASTSTAPASTSGTKVKRTPQEIAHARTDKKLAHFEAVKNDPNSSPESRMKAARREDRTLKNRKEIEARRASRIAAAKRRVGQPAKANSNTSLPSLSVSGAVNAGKIRNSVKATVSKAISKPVSSQVIAGLQKIADNKNLSPSQRMAAARKIDRLSQKNKK